MATTNEGWRRDRLIAQLPVFIDVHDVMASMKCSRAMAYQHMRRALDRQPGERGQIRVPVEVWKRYVAALFDPQAIVEEPSREPTGRSPVPITRARTRRLTAGRRKK
ncbi:MAG: hypothetical protein OEZ06_16190 [Myxococcales bacterium]|nr:hypothetical protein [Myxococcales bacterium]